MMNKCLQFGVDILNMARILVNIHREPTLAESWHRYGKYLLAAALSAIRGNTYCIVELGWNRVD